MLPPVVGSIDEETIVFGAIDAKFDIIEDDIIMSMVVPRRGSQIDTNYIFRNCVVRESVVVGGVEVDSILVVRDGVVGYGVVVGTVGDDPIFV